MKTLKFNEQMIAAIRDGRKTQTRRVMYPQPPDGMKFFHLTAGDAHFLCDDGCTTSGFLNVRFPYLGFIDSNLKIEITGYRCERLGDISESDCIKEGIDCLSKDGGLTYKYGIPDKDGLPGNDDIGWHWHEWELNPKAAFKKLWQSIYPTGTKAWRDDLWVWVIDFEVV